MEAGDAGGRRDTQSVEFVLAASLGVAAFIALDVGFRAAGLGDVATRILSLAAAIALVAASIMRARRRGTLLEGNTARNASPANRNGATPPGG